MAQIGTNGKQVDQGKTDPEVGFEEYRKYLHEEGRRLACFVRLYRRLHERMADRLDEMNLAPAFFGTVIDSLFSVIVLWVDKFFHERSERGLVDFLNFCERNIRIFDIKELQRRRKYPDGHWMLNRDPITPVSIQENRAQISKPEFLSNFRLRRDKFHAHFDKEYFFDRKKLFEDAPLKWMDLEEPLRIIKDIINTYSATYDGNLFELEPINIDDIDRLLDYLHRARKIRADELRREDERIESEKTI
jgi:hypothetical protein